MKFEKVQLNEDFIYNGLVYTKKGNDIAFNNRYGNHIIYPHEKVKRMTNFETSSNYKKPITAFLTFSIGCMIGIIIFLIIR